MDRHELYLRLWLSDGHPGVGFACVLSSVGALEVARSVAVGYPT